MAERGGVLDSAGRLDSLRARRASVPAESATVPCLIAGTMLAAIPSRGADWNETTC